MWFGSVRVWAQGRQTRPVFWIRGGLGFRPRLFRDPAPRPTFRAPGDGFRNFRRAQPMPRPPMGIGPGDLADRHGSVWEGCGVPVGGREARFVLARPCTEVSLTSQKRVIACNVVMLFVFQTELRFMILVVDELGVYSSAVSVQRGNRSR